MSYDLYVLPWHLATDNDSAERVMREDCQTGAAAGRHSADSPLVAVIAQIIDRQRQRGIEHEPPEPLRVGTYVPAAWPDAERSREVVIPLAAVWGFDVYDPQENLYIDTEHAVPISVHHGTVGRFPMLGPRMLDTLIGRLVDPHPFLIIERDSEVYAQTRVRDDGRFDLEYRDGSAERHFATVTDPDRLPGHLWAWVLGGPAALSDMEWTKLDLQTPDDRLNRPGFAGGSVSWFQLLLGPGSHGSW
ncbi:hypothetical protein QNM97_01590 [Gordonia sp. L191]|uniref:hypothetical protein n=1 Tax=Gordonia sp. L191 TaxID=2982699 RepID=UPI0024BFD67C|nr:hypothetical protein [Gordonia sp. L191]WHU47735.1 hypothetical protein QNM97_01590 [Gordonia sp. L191]